MIIFVYIGVAFLLLFFIFWLVHQRKDILKKKKRDGET